MDEKFTLNEFNRKTAIETNNGLWPILDKKNPTAKELEEAIHMAHASRYHWSKIGEPVNLVRGEYMISRVYSKIGRDEPALFHAKRCIEIAEEHRIGDFDIAFAYEAMARAQSEAGNESGCREYREKAQRAIDQVKDPEDRKICQGELDQVKC